MVTEVGDFLLVYVSTPSRYARRATARACTPRRGPGLIKGFTGVSDPYEEPRDADLVLDTSAMTRDQAVSAVLKLLITGDGWPPHRTSPVNLAVIPSGPRATVSP